jgi:hypothetical protein
MQESHCCLFKRFSELKGNLPVVLLMSIALLTTASSLPAASGDKIVRDSLVEDVRQLAGIIEKVHPDPYVNCGGKTAFHHRLRSILAEIPADGMTRADFYRLLRPFITAIGDAHTWLRDAYDDGSTSPGGIPLYFGIVGTDLYVLAVPEERYRPLIGAILISVEGVSFQELLNRSRTMVSAENEYQLLRNLAYTGILFNRPFLADLVPEWQDKSRVRVVLRDKDGHESEHTIPVLTQLPEKWIKLDSQVKRPRPYPEGFAYTFLDAERRTALLVVDDMQSYREMYEEWIVSDPEEAKQAIREIYQRLHQSDAPDDIKETLAGIPSATETFRALVQEMRDAGTKTLLVDLRQNEGGNSTMYNILLFFLYGRDVLIQVKCCKTEIKRLTDAGYDFSEDWYNRIRQDSTAIGDLKAGFEREVEQMPSFADEYRSGRFEKYYLPTNVMVLCSPRTFSSGYTLMYYLYRAGASIVGIPSAQAGNCFGEALSFELKHSKLTGTISQKQYVYFHDDHEMGRVLRPQYMMTYKELKSYAFDPNAEILFALDICKRKLGK